MSEQQNLLSDLHKVLLGKFLRDEGGGDGLEELQAHLTPLHTYLALQQTNLELD